MWALSFAAGTWKKNALLRAVVSAKVQSVSKYVWGGGLKQKALGAEVGCKNALFVAVARETSLQVA